MTDARKLVVVLGATGAQGNPAGKYILQHSAHLFRVRAVTRNSKKPAAQELKSLGAEVVEADFDNEAALEYALNGANFIFAITNFWDKVSYELEVTQGKLVNKLASHLPYLESFIFSSLPDGRGIDGGRFQNILPYNAKAAIREDLQKYTSLYAKTTELWSAFYYQNWLKYEIVFGPVKDENGTFVLSMPYPSSTKVPSSWADDVGVVVDSLLKSGGKYHGKTVVIMADLIAQEEMLSIWAKELGVKATFKQVSPEAHIRRMTASGLPDHVAVAVTELSEALTFEENTLTPSTIVQGKDIIPATYKLKAWKDYVRGEDWSSIL